MAWKPSQLWIALGAWAGGVAFLVSCGSLDHTVISPPIVEGAEFVGNGVCGDCHEREAHWFPSSPHARFYGGDPERAAQAGCESCHGPGSKHVEVGGGRDRFIVNPRKDPAACFECHLEVHAEFRLTQRHPVLEGRISCADCHDPHGADAFKPARGLAMARLNESCAECHREQTRPFVFEHEALREGCVICHAPHGSVNRKLLSERDQNLCLRCHAQVQGMDVSADQVFIGKTPHAAFLSEGTCWSAGCHSAVHGSNVNPLMLY